MSSRIFSSTRLRRKTRCSSACWTCAVVDLGAPPFRRPKGGLAHDVGELRPTGSAACGRSLTGARRTPSVAPPRRRETAAAARRGRCAPPARRSCAAPAAPSTSKPKSARTLKISRNSSSRKYSIWKSSVGARQHDARRDANRLRLQRRGREQGERIVGFDLQLTALEAALEGAPHQRLGQRVHGVDDDAAAVGAQQRAGLDAGEVGDQLAGRVDHALDGTEEVLVRRRRLDDDRRARPSHCCRPAR